MDKEPMMASAPPAHLNNNNSHVVEIAPLLHCNASLVPKNNMSSSKYTGLKIRHYLLSIWVGILTLAFVSYVVYSEMSRSGRIQSPASYPLCLPCDRLKATYLKHLRLGMERTADGRCCVDSDNEKDVYGMLSAMVKKITFDEPALSNSGTGSSYTQGEIGQSVEVRQAADLYYHEVHSAPRTSEVIEHWESKVGQAITLGDVQVRERREIIIPQSGYYSVFCNIQFTFNVSGLSTDDEFASLKLMRQKEVLRQAVVSRSRTYLKESESQDQLQVHGIFYLNENDRLHVEVSKNAVIKSDVNSNFGLFKL